MGQYATDAAVGAVGMLFGNAVAGWFVDAVAGTIASEAMSHWNASEFAKTTAAFPVTYFM